MKCLPNRDPNESLNVDLVVHITMTEYEYIICSMNNYVDDDVELKVLYCVYQ